MIFLKALFGGKTVLTEEEQSAENIRQFGILKHDGLLSMSQGQIGHAVQCFRKALELQDDTTVLSHLAEAYIRMQDLIKAYDSLEKLAERTPENPEVFIWQAQIAFEMKNYRTMCEVCQKAFILDDKNPIVYYLFAKGNHALQDDITDIAMLTKAIMLKEEYNDAYLMRAEILHEMGQWKEAEEDIDFLLERKIAHEEILLLKADLRGKANDYLTAIDIYDKAIEENPFFQKAYIAKAELMAEQGDMDKAIKFLTR